MTRQIKSKYDWETLPAKVRVELVRVMDESVSAWTLKLGKLERDLPELIGLGHTACPACNAFYFPGRVPDRCTACPIRLYTGHSECRRTPYEAAARAVLAASAHRLNEARAALAANAHRLNAVVARGEVVKDTAREAIMNEIRFLIHVRDSIAAVTPPAKVTAGGLM